MDYPAMHPDTPKYVAQLDRRFSLNIVKTNMEIFKRESPELPFWYLNVFIGISGEALKMQYHLKRARQECEVNYIAWAARNILELRIWTLFASSSRENALRFHKDQYVDGLSAVRAMERAAQRVPRDVDAECLRAAANVLRKPMEERAKLEGVDESLPFLSAKVLSKQFQLDGEFEVFQVLCSKLLHSTGFSVLVAQNRDQRESTVDNIFRFGAMYALSILDELNSHLKAEGLPTYD
jgi:hypothetical protein